MNTDKQNDSKNRSSERVKIHLFYLDFFFRIEQNEEIQSEKRIKFFLVLVTGIIAILAMLIKFNIDNEILFKILAIFLSVLFLFGLLVFASVIWSDRKIKQHRQLWTISTEVIKTIDPSVVIYEERLKEMDDNRIYSKIQKIKGTQTQIMLFIEVILFEASMFVLGIIFNPQLTYRILLLIIPVVFVYIVLRSWAHYIKEGIEKNKNNKINNPV